MARSANTNYTGVTVNFEKATAATDPFYKEDVQKLAEAVDTHTHGSGLGLPVSRLAAVVTFNSVAYTLPVADGTSGYVLSTNGSGALTWSSPSAVSDATFRVQDNGDATKQLAFEVSGISAGTTRTVTLRNADGTMGFNPMTTAGDTIYGGAAGLETRLPIGTAYQALLTNSGVTAPVWGDVPIKLGETVLAADAASITSPTLPSSGFRHIEIRGIFRTDRASTDDIVKWEANGDTTATNYDHTGIFAVPGTGISTDTGNNNQLAPCAGNTASANFADPVWVTFFDYARTTWQKRWLSKSTTRRGTASSADWIHWDKSGAWRNTAAITSIVLKPFTGTNFKAGTMVQWYGLP